MTRSIALFSLVFSQKNDYPILDPIGRICKSDGRPASNIDGIELRSGPASIWGGTTSGD